MSASGASPRNSLIWPNIASVSPSQSKWSPGCPAARRRDAGLACLLDDLAWIHGYDALAPATGRGARCSAAAG
jgi:hypothetical protein